MYNLGEGISTVSEISTVINWKGSREIHWESLVCITKSVLSQGTINCLM